MTTYSQDFLLTPLNGAYNIPVLKENKRSFRLKEAQRLAVEKNIPVARDGDDVMQVIVPSFKYYFIEKPTSNQNGIDTSSTISTQNLSPTEAFALAKAKQKPVVQTSKLDGTKEFFTPDGDTLIINPKAAQ